MPMSDTPNDPWQNPGDGDPPPPPPPPPGGGWQQPGGAPPPPGGGWQQPGGAPPPPGGWQQPGRPPGGGWQQPGGAPPPPAGGWQQPGQWQQPGGYGQWQQPGGYPQWQQSYPGSGALAGWWYRVGATLVDVLVLIIPDIVIGAIAGNSFAARYAITLIVQALYVTLMLGSSGRTVGMRALGTYLVDANTGGAISYGKALLRWLGQVVLQVTIIGGILDILWPLWDRQNQTLHDKMVGTVLLRR